MASKEASRSTGYWLKPDGVLVDPNGSRKDRQILRGHGGRAARSLGVSADKLTDEEVCTWRKTSLGWKFVETSSTTTVIDAPSSQASSSPVQGGSSQNQGAPLAKGHQGLSASRWASSEIVVVADDSAAPSLAKADGQKEPSADRRSHAALLRTEKELAATKKTTKQLEGEVAVLRRKEDLATMQRDLLAAKVSTDTEDLITAQAQSAEELSTIKTQLNEAQAKLKDAEAQLKQERSRTKLQAELVASKHKKEMAAAQAELKEKDEAIEASINDSLALQKKVEKAKNDVLEKELEKQKREHKKELEKQKREHKNELEDILKESQTVLGELDEVQEEHQTLQEECKSLREKLRQQEDKTHEGRTDLGIANGKLMASDAFLQAQIIKTKELEEEHARKLQEQSEEYQKQFEEKEAKLRAALKKSNNESHESYDLYTEECAKVTELEKSIDTAKEDNARQMSQLQEEMQVIKADKDAKVLQLQQEIGDMAQKHVVELNKAVNREGHRLGSQLDELRFKLEGEIDKLKKEAKDKDDSNLTLTKEIADLELERDDPVRGYQAQINQYSTKQVDSEGRIKDLTRQNADLRALQVRLQDDYSRASKKKRELVPELEKCQNRAVEAETKLHYAQEELQNSNEDNATLKAELDHARTRVAELEDLSQKLNTTMAADYSGGASLSDEIDKIEANSESLDSDEAIKAEIKQQTAPVQNTTVDATTQTSPSPVEANSEPVDSDAGINEQTALVKSTTVDASIETTPLPVKAKSESADSDEEIKPGPKRRQRISKTPLWMQASKRWDRWSTLSQSTVMKQSNQTNEQVALVKHTTVDASTQTTPSPDQPTQVQGIEPAASTKGCSGTQLTPVVSEHPNKGTYDMEWLLSLLLMLIGLMTIAWLFDFFRSSAPQNLVNNVTQVARQIGEGLFRNRVTLVDQYGNHFLRAPSSFPYGFDTVTHGFYG